VLDAMLLHDGRHKRIVLRGWRAACRRYTASDYDTTRNYQVRRRTTQRTAARQDAGHPGHCRHSPVSGSRGDGCCGWQPRGGDLLLTSTSWPTPPVRRRSRAPPAGGVCQHLLQVAVHEAVHRPARHRAQPAQTPHRAVLQRPPGAVGGADADAEAAPAAPWGWFAWWWRWRASSACSTPTPTVHSPSRATSDSTTPPAGTAPPPADDLKLLRTLDDASTFASTPGEHSEMQVRYQAPQHVDGVVAVGGPSAEGGEQRVEQAGFPR